MLILLFFVACIKYATSARILGIVPTPSYSHQVVFRSLWTELSLRGHEVVVMTTDPINNSSLTNLTEIDLHSAYDIWIKHDVVNFMAENQINLFKVIDKFAIVFDDVIDKQMNNPKVKELYNRTFDIVLTELSFPSMCSFSKLYGCPCIGIMSMDINGPYHRYLGNPTHPILYPEALLPFHGKLTFWERLGSSLMNLFVESIMSTYTNNQNKIVYKYFGENSTSASALMETHIDLVFVNVNPILHPVRPVTPATITIGGATHISALRPLPQVYSINDLVMHFYI